MTDKNIWNIFEQLRWLEERKAGSLESPPLRSYRAKDNDTVLALAFPLRKGDE
ncbi:hypothetical protein L1285_23485 [Pseudoalteromonas sp. DL2-H2.2]|uniref:hypothetical protein n=1 Tax=Pseudoalteromonas sp. DL2-H2.2 TaxID=2908889 RepID=UPI001F1DBBD3|nr:hypothetical protein [Pseudoalteromonas sp. DL2-H2.2]MCF2911258.1 hypothetical protein [Pseudoalteromonas sp. DL2-H2.2]